MGRDLAASVVQRWTCEHCLAEDVTSGPFLPNRYHPCPRFGLTAPMVIAGSRARVEAVEREDYVGSERVALSTDGRPVMAFVTTRDDGQDVAVNAPLATTRADIP